MDIKKEASVINNLFYSSIVNFSEEKKQELKKDFDELDPLDFLLKAHVKSIYHPAAEIYKERKKSVLKVLCKILEVEEIKGNGQSLFIELEFNSIRIDITSKTFKIYPTKYLQLRKLKENLQSSFNELVEAKTLTYLHKKAAKNKDLKSFLMFARYSDTHKKYNLEILTKSFKRINKGFKDAEVLLNNILKNQRRIYDVYLNEQKNIDTYIEKTNSELSNSKVIANLRTLFKEE